MQPKKCLRTLASALIIATAALIWSGAAAAASSYKVIHQFELPKQPTGNLTIDAAGDLYGTTSIGGGEGCGAYGCGTVFKLAPNPKGTWTVSILNSFSGASEHGCVPIGGVIFDAAGNLYGTTSTCDVDGLGNVFKLKPNPDGTWTESAVYSFGEFGGGENGGDPNGGLVFDRAGNLYGTAADGAHGAGVVFKLTLNPDGTSAESTLYSFTGGADGSEINGRYPDDGVILDAAGNLYGTTNGGGTYGSGVVFKLTLNPDEAWTERVLYSFTGGADGSTPYAGLTFDAAGNLYGTTFFGGADGNGVVFKLAPNPDGTWTESVLHSFKGGDGANPLARLTLHAGNLYGTTPNGGDYNACPSVECGVVFKLTPTSSGWSETVVRTFLGLGDDPLAPVTFDSTGNLYGTTSQGKGNYGLVFEITP
jgi:uncharacterized repeat protein (TIGR03803 family)